MVLKSNRILLSFTDTRDQPFYVFFDSIVGLEAGGENTTYITMPGSYHEVKGSVNEVLDSLMKQFRAGNNDV